MQNYYIYVLQIAYQQQKMIDDNNVLKNRKNEIINIFCD